MVQNFVVAVVEKKWGEKMFNSSYEGEYHRALENLSAAIEAYKPFLKSKEKWLTDEEIAACEAFDVAEKIWKETRKKYFGGE